jgi:hypothetical protein
MYILDENHHPVPTNDHLVWGRFFQNLANRTVAKTEIGSIEISTVFIGIDHSFSSPVPILFETMIFGGDLDNHTRRYATWEEAEAGHEEAIAKVERNLHATELITEALKSI